MKLKIPFRKKRALVSVVRMSGVISSGSRGQLNDQSLAPVFEKAFSKGKPDAVALVVNSPGGSPVQSSLIGARIRSLASEKKTPVYAFVEDVAASGGYWLAAAADEIYVDHSSIVGSIGVISMVVFASSCDAAWVLPSTVGVLVSLGDEAAIAARCSSTKLFLLRSL